MREKLQFTRQHDMQAISLIESNSTIYATNNIRNISISIDMIHWCQGEQIEIVK